MNNDDLKARLRAAAPIILSITRDPEAAATLTAAANCIDRLESELKAYHKAERDINEALNSGDGSYKP